MRISGIRRGYEGMIDGDFVSLDEKDLQRTVHKGGTILKTARSERFRKVEGRKTALKNLNKKEIDALIAIEGDGIFHGMLAFSELSTLPFIGIPGTIDNDLAGTDYTLGFDTAVNTAIENIDKIRDTAESHNRVFLIEVMGRDSGYIAIHSGLGTGADGILIPESSEDFNPLLEKIREHHNEEALIVVVSEGDEPGSDLVALKFRKMNTSVDLRISILGHVQRGGHPSAFDRMPGIRLGVASVDALLQERKNVMIGIVNNSLTIKPFKKEVKQHQVGTELQELLILFYLK